MPTRRRGFTLVEVLMVVALVALASALVSLALPRSNNALIRDGERLAALLEAARASSRVTGVPVFWHATSSGFAFEGLPATAPQLPGRWLDAGTRANSSAPIWLGPDPIIAAQRIVLHGPGSRRRVEVSTDGLRPFHVQVLP
ncbi:MAG: prepilin-type N-terminal cleavage/methylation domain-containing protein [Ottowia sp.]|nr:prepilin-type N-terminal cleavage/methylation domain-containing protein [Ottowia sp.]